MGSLSKSVLGGSIHRIREFELEKVSKSRQILPQIVEYKNIFLSLRPGKHVVDRENVGVFPNCTTAQNRHQYNAGDCTI